MGQLAKQARKLADEIASLEETLKDKQKEYNTIMEERLPQVFLEMNLRGFVMDDGSKVEIKQVFGASITEERRAEAFQWLRDHGHDDIIKNVVSVRFGRNEDDLCDRALQVLGKEGFHTDHAQKIEPMTLKGWVREMLQKGDEVPRELFGVFVGQKAVFK